MNDPVNEPAALSLLTTLATLQRRHSGAIILLSSTRTRAWPDIDPEVKVPVDRALLRTLETEGLVMVEPYTEVKPRGTQILGMTSKGWSVVDPITRATRSRATPSHNRAA